MWLAATVKNNTTYSGDLVSIITFEELKKFNVGVVLTTTEDTVNAIFTADYNNGCGIDITLIEITIRNTPDLSGTPSIY